MDPASIAVVSGLIIGLIYGSIGLVSGFCILEGAKQAYAAVAGSSRDRIILRPA